MKGKQIVADFVAWAALLTVLALMLAGGLDAKSIANAFIPKNCLHDISISDFTKPCKVYPNNPNMARCDGVVIHFARVQYREVTK